MTRSCALNMSPARQSLWLLCCCCCRFLGHRPSSMPQDRDWNPHDSVGSHGSFAQASHVQRPTPSHSHANMLAALSDRPPSLADLLGPYFVVLTTPQVADATLQVRAVGVWKV
jgi:hypothetical protein